MFDKDILSLAYGNLPLSSLYNPSCLSIECFLRPCSRLCDFVANGNNGLVARIDIEILIEILERTVRCFGIEKIDYRHK